MRKQSKWHSQLTREMAIALHLQGYTDAEIASDLGIPRNTIYEWTKGIEIPPEIEQEKRVRIGAKAGAVLGVHKAESDDQARRSNYEEGYQSQMTPEDRTCVGFYIGDGAKYPRTFGKSPKWGVTNAERCYIQLMIQWAVRRGHQPDGFGAMIHLHPGVAASEEELKTHWAEAGIPADNIGFLRTKSPGRNRSSCNSPWGTCNLYATGRDGAALFWYMRGQIDRLSENPEQARNETLALLDALHQKETGQRMETKEAQRCDSSQETDLAADADGAWNDGNAA